MKITFALLLAVPSLTQAAVLSGSGNHLPLAPIPHNTPIAVIHPTITNSSGGFTATWGSDVLAPWQGSFTGTGSYTNSGNSGLTVFDFTSLPNSTLPSGTTVVLGDIDTSSSESIRVSAFDSSGNPLSLWLDETYATTGTGRGAGGVALLDDLPGWAWDASDNSYFFDGATVTGFNPAVAVFLETNQAIASAEVIKNSGSYNFSFRAPASIPEPSSFLLCLLGSLSLLRRKRRN